MIGITKRTKMFLLTAGILTFAAAGTVSAETYNLDKAHSSIAFTVKHLVVSTTRGEFTDYDGTIILDPQDLANSKIEITVQAKSIDTRVADRDTHLKSPDFLDIENFPTLSFVSTKIVQDGSQYQVTGNLTIHGVTKEITIPAVIAGPVTTPYGAQAVGITTDFKINRKDYGVNFNKTMDNGGLVVGDEVTVSVSLEANKK